jgi:outer membrane protein assembly factor BamD (BamD/ComL family)
LLGTARAAAARGDRGEALRSYRELIATSPGSGEAQVALVSLAELELQSGASAAALADFDRYLARGGALGLEARYGRIRALEALGRTAEAREAADAFVRDYGGSPQAAALRARAP